MDTHILVKEKSLVPGLVTTRSTGMKLSMGLAGRLKNYAIKRFSERGFGSFCNESRLDIYTLDGEEDVEDRTYMVRFSTSSGGYIELNGIVVDQYQIPIKDFGFMIGEC